MQNIAYLLSLHSVEGFGPVRIKKLLDYFKDPKLAWEISETELKKFGLPVAVVQKFLEMRKKLDPEKYLEYIQASEIKWMTIFDDSYPKLLKQIYDPPIVLYYKGEIEPEDERAFAVVGTRKITGYGKLVTEKFAAGLVESGFTIVSGLARGVDSFAHRAALDNGGRTIAVLGGGLNKLFPPENEALAMEIANGRGAVISEFPPDLPSTPGNFPARNRIISGLSLGVLVTEAAKDSGSLITARLALEQGREVFAVPGPITSDLAKGPAELIKDGASLVTEPKEILEELGMEGVKSGEVRIKNLENLSEKEKKILEILENENKYIDEIGREISLDAPAISAALLKMEIQGLVKNLGSGIYCRV